MVRLALAILLALPLAALDNAIRFTATATQTGRPFDLHRWFARGEIANYPQPFFDASSPAAWGTEVTTRWPDGSVKTASIYFRADVTDTTTHVIDFRNNANPCSSGNQAACNAAALDEAGILAFNGGTWQGTMTATAYPQGTSTARVSDVRAMIDAGHFAYLHRSAAATKILVEDRSTSLTYDFGWTLRRVVMPNTESQYSINDTATSRTVIDASHWTGIGRPFKITIDSESISVCYVTATVVYFGTTNGSDASCASSAGRGQDGTSAAAHATGALRLNEARWLTASVSGNTLSVNDGGLFTSPSVLQVGNEKIRICNISGNTLTVGTAGDGCSASGSGRYWAGTNTDSGAANRTPIVLWESVTDIWVDAAIAAQKSLHPAFVVTLYPGYAGVGIEMMTFNSWTGRMQDQEYDVDFAISDATASRDHVRHIPGTAWKWPDGENVGKCAGDYCDRKWWDGTTPAGGRFDYNLAYLRYSKAIAYDDTIGITQSAVNYAVSTEHPHSQGATPPWNTNSKGKIETAASVQGDRAYCGFTFRGVSSPGIRGDIGLNPYWNVVGLYAMSANLTNADLWLEWTLGLAGCAGSFPYVWFESDTNASLKFCNGGTSTASPTAKSCSGGNEDLAALGYPVSIDARPGINYYPSVNATTTFMPSGPITFNLWGTDDVTGHMPEMLWVPWLLTGDWYYQRLMAGRAGWQMWAANGFPGWASGETQYWIRKQHRKGDWGLIGPIGSGGGPRNMAWGWNLLTNAYFAQATGTPEEQWIKKKIDINLATWEGKFGITAGNFYQPCPSSCADDYSYWYYGRRWQGNNIDMSLFSFFDAHGGGASNDQPTYIDNAVTRSMVSYWSEMYVLVAMSSAFHKGLTGAGPVREQAYKTFTPQVTDATLSPWMISAYRSPGNPCAPLGCGSYPNATGQEFLFASWADWWSGWTTLARDTYYKSMTDSHDPTGRAWLALQVANLGDDIPAVKKAADWLRAGVTNQGLRTTSPQWWASPQEQHEVRNLRVTANGSTTATVQFTRPPTSNSCEYLVYEGGGVPASSLQSSEPTVSNANGGRAVTLSLTDLTTATTYGVRVTCGLSARAYVQFTTD